MWNIGVGLNDQTIIGDYDNLVHVLRSLNVLLVIFIVIYGKQTSYCLLSVIIGIVKA